jgi:nifR3 family TIM-barrel protein
MRALCVAAGASFCVSEMVSAKGIIMGDRCSDSLMHISLEEQPCGIQLFGREPSDFAKAVPFALAYTPAFIDINMGCPAAKIAGSGSGAALMREPDRCGEIVQACIQAVQNASKPTPISVKLRTGWNENQKNVVEVARICEAAGAARITVHGRTRAQMYAPPMDYAAIRVVKQAVGIPVLANGDVVDGASAQHMLLETGCDGLMIGRGAQGRPWIFQQINTYLQTGEVLPEPPISERMAVMLEHVRRLCLYKGDYIGIREARKHAAWYLKGIRGAAQLRQEICQITAIAQLEAIAQRIISWWE